jgi:hypothetical protein
MSNDELSEESFQVIEEFFRNYEDINPHLAKIHYGAYYAIKDDRTPFELKKIDGMDPKFTVPFTFYLDFYETPIGVAPVGDTMEGDDVWYPFTADRTWRRGGNRKSLHLVETLLLSDAAEDSTEELYAMSFDYAGFFRDMGIPLRRELYAKSLWDIHEVPKGMTGDEGKTFINRLGSTATYDEKGAYYPKWKKRKENKHPRLMHVTQEYVSKTYTELKLVKGYVYCLVTSADRLVVYQLIRNADDRLERIRYYDNGDSRPAKQKDKVDAGEVEHTCVFFHADDGVDEVENRGRNVAHSKKSLGSFSRIADPQVMVEEALGKDAVGRLGLRDPYHWFVEMVSTFFPQRFYPVDITNIKQTSKVFNYADAQMLKVSLDEKIKKAMTEDPNDEYGGVFTDESRREVERMLKDPRWLVLPQGLSDGPGRFIGIYDGLCYSRNLETGLVHVTPLHDYVNGLALGDFVSIVYKNTAWIVPFVTYGTYAILAVATLGTVGFAAGVTAAGVRQAVVQYARREVTNRVIWEITKKLGPAAAAMLAKLVLALFSGKSDEAARWKAFADGFLNGYVYEILYDHLYKNVLDVVTKGPKEWRMAMSIKKMYRVLDQVHEFLARVQDELDEPSIERAVDNFGKAAQHLVNGAVLLLAAMYYVPHKETGGILDALGKGEQKDGPDEDEWDAEAAAIMSEVAKSVVNGLLKADKIDDLLVTLKDSKLLKAGLVLVVLRQHIGDVLAYTWKSKKKKKTSWKRKAFFATAIAAVTIWAGYEANEATDGKVVDTIFALLEDAFSSLPGGTEERAKTNGKVVGNLLGGFMLNRFLYKDGESGDKHRKVLDSPVLGTSIKHNFKYGIVTGVLKVVFRRYVALYDELVEKGIFGAARGEGIFAKLIGDLYEQELDARGLGHLKKFESKSEKMVTLNDVVMTLLGIYRVLDGDHKDFLKKKYGDDIAMYKEDLSALKGWAEATGLSHAVEEHLPQVYHLMTQHLRLALNELIEALQLLFKPFKDGGVLSWITLLAELGLDVGDPDALQREVQEIMGKELEGFKAKGE